MSQNTDHSQLSTSSSPSISTTHNKRLPSHQHFLSTSSDLNTPSSIVNTIRNDSPSTQSTTSPIASDVCVGNQNGVRNASTTMKINDITSSNNNHLNNKYAFTLDFTPPVVRTKKVHHRSLKTQLYSFDMAAKDEEDLRSPFELDVPLCENPSLKKVQNDFLIDRMLKDEANANFTSPHRSPNQTSYTNLLNHASPLLTPSSDHHDIDALSDAGTYIIEDEQDIAQDDEPEQEITSTEDRSSFKRYATKKRTRHGTFDLNRLSSPTQTVNRPVVDSNIPTHDLCSSSSKSSSSSSSLLSFSIETDNSIRKEPEGASHHISDDKSSNGIFYARQRPTTLLSLTPPSNQIKPAECFVISPIFETKSFPHTTTAVLRRKTETQRKAKPIPTNLPNFELPPTKKSPSSPLQSARSNQSDTEKYSFRLKQQLKTSMQNSDSLSKSSPRSQNPPPTTNDQTYLSSSFQRNSSIRQTMPANTQYNRTLSSSTTNKYPDDNEEMLSSHPSLTKVYMNKSFALRRQRSNLTPPTSKPIQQQQPQQVISKPLPPRQLLKPTASIPSSPLSTNNSNGQTNRAVELRRARAQAKIEELAQRTRQQLQKTEQHNDIMSASWHSNASSSSKKDYSYLRSNPRSNNNNVSLQKQDMTKTRTISSTSYHRSSSASPNPVGETTPKYRKAMISSVTDESQYQKMNGSIYNEGERCDSLRDNGQRLAIKLIQLSSGILAKLKPNNTQSDNDSNVRELEQLVDKLQTVNQQLSTIDASLTDPTSDETLI